MRALLAGFLLLGACAEPALPGGATTVPDEVTAPAPTTTPGRGTTSASTTSFAVGELPVVASRSGMLGWWDGATWVTSADADLGLVFGDTLYQVVDLEGLLGTVVGSAPQLCEPSGTPVIDFAPGLPGDYRHPGAIAVAANWELMPRSVAIHRTANPEDLEAARSFLRSQGLKDDPPVHQYVTADLDGDGIDEGVLVVRRVPDDLLGGPGDYSLALMRKVVEGEWQTLIFEFSQGVADNPYVVSHSIAAIADLNGDSRSEVVIDSFYYEGAGTAAYEYVDDDLGALVVLSGGCGA
ncbi:MAG: hypothetical protein ACT4OP_06205 [Actinomycetota bacterium]